LAARIAASPKGISNYSILRKLATLYQIKIKLFSASNPIFRGAPKHQF
jgi:hypothetical protein